MKTARTQEEILNHIKEINDDDLFGFQTSDLIDFLDFKDAKQYLKEGVTKSLFNSKRQNDAIKNIKEYMAFAWDKANSCRGLSANRSIEHMLAWTWMIDDEFYKKLKKSYELDYKFYGKPQLILICEHFNIDWKKLHNGIYTNSDTD